MADDFNELVTRMSDAERAQSEGFLGRLTWYSISEICVPHDQVIQALVAAGVTRNLPMPPSDVDIFRRVSTAAARKRVPRAVGVADYLVRELREKRSSTLTRRIVRESFNDAGHRLDYSQLLDVTFNRTDGSITTKWVDDVTGHDDTALEIGNHIQAEFTKWRGCLNAYAIREWIRHFILELDATLVRPGGGVYFVKEEHVAKLEALETLADILPDCTIHSLPLPDDRKQRLMVQKAFEAETSGEIDKLLGEIAGIRDQGTTITDTEYAGYLDKFHELTGKTTDYSSILSETLDTTRTRLDLFQRSIMQLMANMAPAQPAA